MDNSNFSAGESNGLMLNHSAVNSFYDQAKRVMRTMVEYKDMQMLYTCALKEIETKFEILSTEFSIKHKRNPINSISSRLKRTDSIAKKLVKYNFPVSVESIE